MRRYIFVLLFAAAACRREQPAAPPVVPSPKTPAAPTATFSTASAPAPVAPVYKRSTPEHCNGDGSYEQAMECVRIAAHLKFTSTLGDGELTRTTIGAEKLSITAADGKWTAEPKPSGIVWTKNGEHTRNVPQPLERLYQRLAIFPDPQKKEGKPQLAATEGNMNRYEFTDANNGDKYVVWVSKTDGHMTKAQIGGVTITFG